uniref:Uncharacterized protein n=1 Tax=Solanum lycopersicum TaxID=4081 RepID=A0A3Q7ITK7_SOLLC
MQMVLQASISSIKRNTRMLICNQLDKIKRLISEKMWSMHHIIATDVFKEDREEDIDEAWRNTVLQPCLDIVKRFLKSDHHNIIIEREIEPDSDFTAEDFCLQAIVYIEKILKTQQLVDEVRQIFIPDAYYTKGIRRSIGVPEMDRYLRKKQI